MRKLIFLVVSTGILTLAIAASASAYLNVENCLGGLRYGTGGDYYFDNDVHAAGLRYGAKSFGGFANAFHPNGSPIWVRVTVHFNGGYVQAATADCHGNNGFFGDSIYP